MDEERLTVGDFNNIINKCGIPSDCVILTDSGWECDPTEVIAVFYNETEKVVVFTQGQYNTRYTEEKGYKCIYGSALE